MKRNFTLLLLTLMTITLNSQTLDHVNPPHWYVGTKNSELQLLLHGKDISNASVEIDNPDVKILKVNKVENPGYLFVDLDLSDAKAGWFDIELKDGDKLLYAHKYELKERGKDNGKTRTQGVNSKDFIYLILPDRFSNGDSSNDKIKEMRDTLCDRTGMYFRHGGDLKGVQNHIDYFKELGVTALWLNPVVENDMPLIEEDGTMRSTYHGYAFTDHYQIDRRLGGNRAYSDLIDALHAEGIKIVQDAIYNHVGAAHWFVEDLPMKDWLNQWPEFQQTSYKDQPLVDPYSSKYDRDISSKGWFTEFMPDLNQRNPFVKKFLIQHAIWTTEYFGIDGWRVDTYFYSDEQFMNDVNDALLAEFPELTVFGETWINSAVNCAYFCENNIGGLRFNHNLQGVTDFPVYFAINDALNQDFGWTEGVNRLYAVLASDVLYKNPYRNCLFLDNHDLDRFYSVTGEDSEKFKIGITWLLTLRGIPQLYYGTEILMKNFKNPNDAMVRQNFPGGWPSDKINKFTAEGRTEAENEAFDYIKTLANYRKTSSALTTGKFMHFTPFDEGIYACFRYDDKQTIMIIVNTAKEKKTVDTERFAERMSGFEKAENVITGETLNRINKIELNPMQILVLELL